MTSKGTGNSKGGRKGNGRNHDGKPQRARGGAAKRGRAAAGEADAKRVAMAIAEEGLDKKAQNVEIIDVRGKVDYADYVVVMSGRSDRQVNAIAKGVEQGLQEKDIARCLGVEGLPQGNWVLMDFGDVVVHVFHQDTRGYYDLESLWIDAARVNVAEG